MEFVIADASITEFDFTNNTLYYNFKLNITVRNPNFEGESMGRIPVISSYKGNKFAMVDMESTWLYGRNTILLKPLLFYGNSLIRLNAQKLIEYHNETRLRIFNLDLKLNKYNYCLGLRIPLISNEKLESTFRATNCTVNTRVGTRIWLLYLFLDFCF
ncbi:hypothetical protein KIW84_046084 [Lathyrus oleraceus]|uniref:Late embryogenesis abundant protein LEA-2 subgroup domain-containing protein n=1 Tax=Pisum sativum TaxID=3888 RepID=A0A9D5AY31_PEA|nr:hypothetical protein KIW84_046084 [Pisum sativum]